MSGEARSGGPRVDLFFTLMACFYAGCLVLGGILAAKIVTFWGINFPAGVIAYSLTFVCTDVVAEVYGRRAAGRLVGAGLAVMVLSLILIRIAVIWTPASFYEGQAAFAGVLGLAPRIMIASIVAFLISQFHDVWAFHLLRGVTGGRFLWLRNNISTGVSQFIDSTVFICVAFWGIMPVWPLILGQWLSKIVLAVLDTPLVYLLVGWANRNETAGSAKTEIGPVRA